jgi:hypothetical protein
MKNVRLKLPNVAFDLQYHQKKMERGVQVKSHCMGTNDDSTSISCSRSPQLF